MMVVSGEWEPEPDLDEPAMPTTSSTTVIDVEPEPAGGLVFRSEIDDAERERRKTECAYCSKCEIGRAHV